jgi:hypothetical protein
MEWHLDLYAPSLRVFSTPPEVFNRFIDALHHQFLILAIYTEDATSLPAILPRDHLDNIVPTDVHLNHLARQTHDLHEVPLAELPSHRPKDPSPLGIPLLIDNDRGIAIKSHVAPIFPARRLFCTNHYRPNHCPLFEIATRDHTFHAADNNVTHAGISSP